MNLVTGVNTIPKIVSFDNGFTKTRTKSNAKAQRKAEYEERIRQKKDAIEKERIDKLIDSTNFTNEERTTGKLYKSIWDYYVGCDQFNIYLNEEPKPFPTEFPTKDAIVFDNTYVIGVDTNDITYRATSSEGVRYMPIYDDSTPDVKAEFDKCIKAGERSNSKMMIFNKHEPTVIHSVKINIWENPTASDCWYKYDFRPNRIYLSDFDGFKIFDFELNLIYFKAITTDSGLYGFKVNPENWNNVTVWSENEAKDAYGRDKIDVERKNLIYKNFYSDMHGFESVCEHIST